MNYMQSENKSVRHWGPLDGLESSIWVWGDREPSKEHILWIVLRFQALQTAVIGTEYCTRLRIVEGRSCGLRLGLRTYGKRFVQILPRPIAAALSL
jgi:hypothetical protein